MEPKRQGPQPEPFGMNDAQDAVVEQGENFRVPTARGVLSAAEIAALLRPDIPEDEFEPEPETVTERPVFDFEVGGEGGLLSGDAQTLAAEMTVALRKHCGIDAVLALRSASYSPMSKIVSLHSQPAVLILFACGGEPVGDRSRPLSALDGRILEHMLAPLAVAIDPSFQIICVETDRSAAFAMLPPGKAMLADLSCQLGPVAGRMIFARVQENQLAVDPGLPAPALSATVTARIARISVPISKLSNLVPGSVLRLGVPKDQPVELLSGGREGPVIAEGDIGRKGECMALRISKCSPALKGVLPKP